MTPPDITPIQLADAYFLAAYWHDKQASACENRRCVSLVREIRLRAADEEKHHLGSAAGLRLAATNLLRTNT